MISLVITVHYMKAGTSGCTQTVPVCTCGRWVLEPGMGGRPMRADRRLGCLYWTRVRTGVYGLAIRARSTQQLVPGSAQPLGLSGLRGEGKKWKKKTKARHKEQTKAQASLESGNEKTCLESGNKKEKKPNKTKSNEHADEASSLLKDTDTILSVRMWCGRNLIFFGW